jgi:transglutaminase-like putative cysteine protease
VRLLAFAALAGICALSWSELIASAPAARIVACLAVVVAGAAGLQAISRLPASLARRRVLALGAWLVVLAVSLIVVGVPADLLWPSSWDELGAKVSDGVGALGNALYPYNGPVAWGRIVLVAGMAGILCLAVLLTFWPRREGSRSDALAGLATLLGGFAIAVAIGGQKAAWVVGPLLLACVAAWLWLPRAGRRRALLAGVAVGIAGIVAVPAAAALDGDEPWVDYESWTWDSIERSVAFDWDHRYGPIDWPRNGTTLLEVLSDDPHYWRTAVLDRFYGTHWARSTDEQRPLELPSEVEGTDAPLVDEWRARISVTVRALRSPYLVSPGRTQRVNEIEAELGGNGITIAESVPGAGSEYQVDGYEPDPSAAQMRRSLAPYPRKLGRYTRVDIAASQLAETNPNPAIESIDLLAPTRIPLREGAQLEIGANDERTMRASGYEPVFRLSQRLTAGLSSPYAIVRAVERHLQDGYVYSEDSPTREQPLRAFLFRDRVGYCQQFSGAMALLLRMSGIPSRVATGFAPGSPTLDDGAYEVTDLDAHSWVEVYFMGIGWVPFDPTPGIAPAELQAGPGDLTAAPGGGSGEGRSSPDEPDAQKAAESAAEGGSGGVPWAAAFALAIVLAAGGFALAAWRRSRRFAALSRQRALAAQSAEIRTALDRSGQRVPAGATLQTMERRLERNRRPRAAAYLESLREATYGPAGATGPSKRARRAVRRELRAGRSPRSWLRSLAAMPPGAPRAGRDAPASPRPAAGP